jgi:hypothetical protein
VNTRSLRSVIVGVALLVVQLPAFAADYLPLEVGNKWVLRNAGSRKPVVIEVVSQDGGSYHISFSNPWGANDWGLEARGNKVFMTGYGANGQLAPVPDETVFFDFSTRSGASWENTIGKLSVNKTGLAVRAGSNTFQNCIQIKQVSGGTSFYYAFAPGIGFVQFGEGKNAFTLDVSESKLPSGRGRGRNASDADPDAQAPHVPGAVITSNGGISRPKRTPAARVMDKRPLQVGVTTSIFANEAQTPQNLLKRFEQTVDAGITFMSAAQKWQELETKPGKYNFEGLDFQIQYAERLKVPMSVTLRMIDTVDRVLPNDLKRLKWDDPKMEARVLGLIDAMAPRFRGRVKWFMFGNEIDGYFGRHQNEVAAFAKLLRKVEARVKQHSPETQVSSTIMFGGIETLDTLLRPLDEQWDFLAITYYPIKADFTMRPPDSPYTDFQKMRQYASSRKVVLQEIGYATSSLNGSSQDMQARFYEATFDALRQNRDLIEAGNFFLLADLSDQFVKDLSGFYGLNAKVFTAYLQTLGMFDTHGRPKKSWTVFQRELKRKS